VLARELREARGGLDAFAGGDTGTDARAVFSWSYHMLSGPAAKLFRLLGLHPGPDIGIPAAASLAGLHSGQIRPLLAELAHAHLVTEHAPGRYGFHDLLRSYATELAHRHDPGPGAALRRVLDHYLHLAYGAALLLNPHREPITPISAGPGTADEEIPDYERALAWFTAEHAVLLAAVRQADRTGLDVHAWQLAWTLANYLHRRGHWDDLAGTQRTALAAARRLADPAAQATAHRYLANAYSELGNFDDAQAELRQALEIYAMLDQPVAEAHTHIDLGRVCERQERRPDALRHALLALDLFRAAGHLAGQAAALNAVGWLHALAGEGEQALLHCQQALVLHQKTGERHGQAATWDSIGYAHHVLGDHDEAIACYRQARDLYRSMGDRYNEAEILIHLGESHREAGSPAEAERAWRGALDILDQLDHPEADRVRTKLSAAG
jgi:tetratricopeptide (TPR) repeat protein